MIGPLIAAGWVAGWLAAGRVHRLPAADGDGGAAWSGPSVSVVVPIRDEAARLPALLGALTADGRSDVEMIVVDDGSSDGSGDLARRAGATVIEVGPPPGWTGKAWACWQGALRASGDVLVFLDADVRNFDVHFVVGLLGPVLTEPGAALVKATYRRPLEGSDGPGGRVTELVARPLLARLFPELAGVAQPLAGECAAPRSVLEAVAFADGYGVEVGLLIDVAARCGPGALAQVDLGERVHRNRPLDELAPQAAAVIDVVLDRAGWERQVR